MGLFAFYDHRVTAPARGKASLKSPTIGIAHVTAATFPFSFLKHEYVSLPELVLHSLHNESHTALLVVLAGFIVFLEIP